MKRDILSPFLTVVLFLMTAATALAGYQYLKGMQQMRMLQEHVNLAGQRRAAIQAMAFELNEYARRDPSIEPLLERVGMRGRPNTNSLPHP